MFTCKYQQLMGALSRNNIKYDEQNSYFSTKIYIRPRNYQDNIKTKKILNGNHNSNTSLDT